MSDDKFLFYPLGDKSVNKEPLPSSNVVELTSVRKEAPEDVQWVRGILDSLSHEDLANIGRYLKEKGHVKIAISIDKPII